MTKVDLDLVRAIEERGFNSWPALRTILFDGWVIRLSDGHTRRANSASPLAASRLGPDALIDAVEPLFRAANLRPIFRITPLADPAVERRLLARGWRDDDPSLGMFARDPDGAADAAVRFEPAVSEAWIAGATAAYGHGERGASALRRLLPLIVPPATFATLIGADGQPLAYGLAVAERGMVGFHDVVVAPSARGRGLGRRLVAALIDWGRQQGASSAYLLVRAGNQSARALYHSLGFAEVYRYANMTRD
ncbi:MAG TPA: GNAT family N-acetyltransferase [Roseiarcus sp.]|nr:GNAT family N-acetyltransferase [Roseiarcus sp.]